MRAVIYTAIFDGYDSLKEPAPQDQPCDFICFTDGKLPSRVGAWLTLYIERDRTIHPRLQAKRFKIMSHLVFPRGRLAFQYAPLARRVADLSIWIDGNIQVTSPHFVSDICKRLADGDWAMFIHPDRNCIYEEAQACVGMRKYRNLPILPQVESYRAMVPAHSGLHAAGVIVRREPATKSIRMLNEAWWAENLEWTYQDQLSLQYVLCRLGGPEPRPIRENIWSNPWFDILPHTNDA